MPWSDAALYACVVLSLVWGAVQVSRIEARAKRARDLDRLTIDLRKSHPGMLQAEETTPVAWAPDDSDDGRA